MTQRYIITFLGEDKITWSGSEGRDCREALAQYMNAPGRDIDWYLKVPFIVVALAHGPESTRALVTRVFTLVPPQPSPLYSIKEVMQQSQPEVPA